MGVAQSFGKIMEGADGAFVPEVAYVKQGKKVLFFRGGASQLVESLSEDAQIVESINDLELTEITIQGRPTKHPKNGEWVVEGPYQRSDTKNANGRTYGRKIWERIVGDPKSQVQQAIKEGGGLLGHLEHPADGRMNGKEGGIVTRALTLKEDGVVWGKSEVLDTPNGLILQEYTKKNIRWGVSSRGNGSVDENGKVNETDYQLETFDAVMKPSTPGAYPKPVNAGIKRIGNESEGDGTADESAIAEEAKTFITEAQTLIDAPAENLDESSRFAFVGKLIDALTTANDLADSSTLPAGKAHDLQVWLTKKLKAVNESAPTDASDAVEKAIREAEIEGGDAEMRGQAIRRMVERFERRIGDAVEEAEGLRTRLAEAKEASTTFRQKASAMEAERDSALDLLNEANERAAKLQTELDAACELISNQSAQEVKDGIAEAVEAAIKQVPELEGFRDVLAEGGTPESVERIAESLIPTITEIRREKASAPTPKETIPNNRLTLPKGVVESEGTAGNRTPATNPSAGASLAAKAIAARGLVESKPE
jgi:hypothetical protein